MKKVAIIIGSSRNDGNTRKLVDEILNLSHCDVVDLNDYNISYYDYIHTNVEDDYLKLMQKLINNYDTFLFATPVYWYAMSGIMKVFFDRFTDLLDCEKELGRKLRTKRMATVTCSIGDNLGDNFCLPFIETSKYLGMEYLGNLHTITNKLEIKELENFIQTINKE